MTRHTLLLQPGAHDGTSQRQRALPALDPASAPLDERGMAQMLTEAQALAARLRWFAHDAATDTLREAGTWAALVTDPAGRIGITDMLAFLDDPSQADDAQARWMTRPHLVLLLVFLRLLDRWRAQFNGLTARHLDHHLHAVLQLRPQPPVPDRAAVVFRLAPRSGTLRLPAGTALDAGRDAAGQPQVYRTERDLLIGHAAVAQLRSVHVDRLHIGIPQVRDDRALTASGALDATLRLALGEPAPGDAVPPWRGAAVDTAFLRGLRPVLDLCRADRGLFLEHFELRLLMRLLRQRERGVEWPRINALLGDPAPASPRDFTANLAAAVAPQVLDFRNDALPQVNSIDDLFHHAGEDGPRRYIDTRLARIGFDAFMALMPLKLRTDAEWGEINRLLSLAGQRRTGDADWHLPPAADPTAFADNLRLALGGTLPAWPLRATTPQELDTALRDLETHLGMTIERIDRLVAFATVLDGDKAEAFDWTDADRLLADAHRERVTTRRRARLAAERNGNDGPDGLLRQARRVIADLQLPPAQAPADWDGVLALLGERGRLSASQCALLDAFRHQLADPSSAGAITWAEADALLELAWRAVQQLPEPVAQRIEWRNLHAFEDARSALADPLSPRWKTFGRRPVASADQPPAPNLGWAVSSPLLRLSEGRRELKLTLGLHPDSFDRGLFLRRLGLTDLAQPADLLSALTGAWVAELSTADGWVAPVWHQVRLSAGQGNGRADDYWALAGLARDSDAACPALQLTLLLAPDADPVAPPPGQDQPQLRLRLRPHWQDALQQWTTQADAFEPLRLVAVHVAASVQGLQALRLQAEDRALDARKPFEPFGTAPARGARLYISHDELARERLQSLALHIEWMALPPDLAAHYARYGASADEIKTLVAGFTAGLALLERGWVLPLAAAQPLFDADGRTDWAVAPATLLDQDGSGFSYQRRSDAVPPPDLRDATRCLRVELDSDLGHGSHPRLAALWAARLAAQLAAQAKVEPGDYLVNPPYLPRIKALTVDYSAAFEWRPPAQGAPAAADAPDADRLLHLHPFGSTRIAADSATLLPVYDQAGELCIGLRDVDAPQHLALLLQLAEGTSDPDAAPAAVSWSCLDGERWRPLDVVDDGTRGLLNSGIVELALPAVRTMPAAGVPQRLPAGLTWLRLAVSHDTRSVCDTVDIVAQAAAVRFDDNGNAPEHYLQPLPVGSITQLVQPDARIAQVLQPYTSFGGRPTESQQAFLTRVSERLRHRERAVAPWDIERLVLQAFPQIYKAKCLRAHATPGEVVVVVIPDIRNALPGEAAAPKAPADLLLDIERHLAARASAAAVLRVRNARYVPVRVRLSVRFTPGQDEGFAKRRLNQDLVRFLAPWAFDDGAEAMIGGRVYANSLVDFIDRRDYVAHVADLKLFRVRDGHPEFVPPADDYHIATEWPDEVLVAAPEHDIDVIPETGYRQDAFSGIGFMKVELDFIVHD